MNEYPVVVYTQPTCGYCTMAKKLLNDEKIAFKEIGLDVVRTQNPSSFQVLLL